MASAIFFIFKFPASSETILNEIITPYKIAAVAQASAKGRASAGLKLKTSTMILENYIRLQNTASSCKHKVQYRGLFALRSLWVLNLFGRGKKIITDFG